MLDIRLGLKPEWNKDNNEDITDELQKQIAVIHQAAKELSDAVISQVQTILRQKTTATPLNDYCYVLNPKADNQL